MLAPIQTIRSRPGFWAYFLRGFFLVAAGLSCYAVVLSLPEEPGSALYFAVGLVLVIGGAIYTFPEKLEITQKALIELHPKRGYKFNTGEVTYIDIRDLDWVLTVEFHTGDLTVRSRRFGISTMLYANSTELVMAAVDAVYAANPRIMFNPKFFKIYGYPPFGIFAQEAPPKT